MAPLLSIDEARAAVLAAVTPLDPETISVADALDRVLAEDIVAAGNVPPFANSAMDGYLVMAGSAGRALRVVGESRAGHPADRAPIEGEAIRISTGAYVPDAGEAVIPIEQVTSDPDGGSITLEADVPFGQHIRHAGEDVKEGATLLRAGTVLGPAEVGAVVIAGRAHLQTAPRPRVSIVATGDELVPPGRPLRPGQIHESNGMTLGALAQRANAEVLVRAHVKDTPSATRSALEHALSRSDVVVASGGVSVGAHDHVKGALDDLGVTERFWRVALRPGKPTWFGTHGDTLVFGLPGNPVSAMVTFLLFVRPALAKLQGADPAATRVAAKLTQPLPRLPGRDEAVRVRLELTDDGHLATPTGPQGSHQLTSMIAADGLAILTAGEGVAEPGTKLDVELI